MKKEEKENVIPDVFKQFLTVPEQREGKKITLYDNEGKETEHWVRIIGVDCENAKFSLYKLRETLIIIQEKFKKDKDEKVKFIKSNEARLDFVCDLISGWSFTDIEPTKENIKSLLKDAPHIVDAIDQLSGDRGFFLRE